MKPSLYWFEHVVPISRYSRDELAAARRGHILVRVDLVRSRGRPEIS